MLIAGSFIHKIALAHSLPNAISVPKFPLPLFFMPPPFVAVTLQGAYRAFGSSHISARVCIAKNLTGRQKLPTPFPHALLPEAGRHSLCLSPAHFAPGTSLSDQGFVARRHAALEFCKGRETGMIVAIIFMLNRFRFACIALNFPQRWEAIWFPKIDVPM